MKNLITNKNIVIAGILVAVFIAGATVFVKRKDNLKPVLGETIEQEKVKIAGCPSYHQLAKNLDKSEYEFIPTVSTAESIKLLQNKQVDLVLAGRTLRPEEPEYDSLVVADGFSFLSGRGETIFLSQLKDYQLFSDLNVEELTSRLMIKNIRQVDNVYDYLDQGIIITSWENTDYDRAEIVHVFGNNNQRLALSRRPTIYCPQSCADEKVINLLNNLKTRL